jgi:hypothetical protein
MAVMVRLGRVDEWTAVPVCMNCTYEYSGQCRRYPPYDNGEIVNVDGGHWCGEFKVKEEK